MQISGEAATMRVMMINKATAETEAGVMPSQKLLDGMGALMREMAAAGVLLGGDGLKASAHGIRVGERNGKRVITDGPFAETKELLAGYAIVKVDSMADAVRWANRMLDLVKEEYDGDLDIELRPFIEPEDFGDAFTPEARAAEERLRAQIGRVS